MLVDFVALTHEFACHNSELKHAERKNRRAKHGLRPTSSRTRAAIISMLGPDGASGITALDLYAGTGGVGFDLLDHGALHVDFVEIDRRRAAKINQEIATRNLNDKASTYQADAIRVLRRLAGETYDLVFADPPYGIDPWQEVIAELNHYKLLKPDAWIIAEHSSRNTLPDQISGANAINRKRYGDTSITIYKLPQKRRN